MTRYIGIEKARGDLGHLVEDVAATKEPIGLTKRGHAVAMVVSREEYSELKQIANRDARGKLRQLLDQTRHQVSEAGLSVEAVDEAIAAARRLSS